MKRKSLAELKTLLENDLAYQKHNIETFESNENPQIKEMYNKSIVRAEAIEDILLYMRTGSIYQFDKLED